MRWQITLMVLAVLGFIGLDLALGQSQFQMFGGIAALFGKETHPDPIALIRIQEVKKELGLTDDDSKKVDVALWKALKEALDESKYKRLKQIDLQQRGYKAFGDPIVQGELRLNDIQKTDMSTILSDMDEQIDQQVQVLQQGMMSGNYGALGAGYERIKTLGKETKERCTEVLNPDQRRLWQEMVGEEFKMPSPQLELPGLKNFDIKGLDKKNFNKGGGKKG